MVRPDNWPAYCNTCFHFWYLNWSTLISWASKAFLKGTFLTSNIRWFDIKKYGKNFPLIKLVKAIHNIDQLIEASYWKTIVIGEYNNIDLRFLNSLQEPGTQVLTNRQHGVVRYGKTVASKCSLKVPYEGFANIFKRIIHEYIILWLFSVGVFIKRIYISFPLRRRGGERWRKWIHF